MRRNRNVEELSEDKQIRTVKLHFHRFGKFLRYLKQQDAVIELRMGDRENGNGQVGMKQVYTAGKRDGNPSIEDLVADALDVNGSLAREYTSRKLGVDDRHSDGDKIYATGKVIDAITFYMDGDSGLNGLNKEEGDFLMDGRPFAVRNDDPFASGLEFSRPIKNLDDHLCRDHYLADAYDQFGVDVLMELKNLQRGERSLEFAAARDGLFASEMRQLQAIYGEALSREEGTEPAELVKRLWDAEDYYFKFIKESDREYSILPDYQDFVFAFRGFFARRSLEESLGDLHAFLDDGRKSLEELLPYRYEILWTLAFDLTPVSRWDLNCQVLLMLAYAEQMAAKYLLMWSAETIVKDLRFVVLSNDDSSGLNMQRDSFDLKELSELLLRYNFRGGLQETIQVSDSNLINEPILKYPEPHAARGMYSIEAIEKIIGEKLLVHFHERVREELHIPDSFSRA